MISKSSIQDWNWRLKKVISNVYLFVFCEYKTLYFYIHPMRIVLIQKYTDNLVPKSLNYKIQSKYKIKHKLLKFQIFRFILMNLLFFQLK